MIKRSEYNAGLLKGNRAFNRTTKKVKATPKEPYRYLQATSYQISKIRAKMSRLKKEDAIKTSILLFVSILLTGAMLSFVLYAMTLL